MGTEVGKWTEQNATQQQQQQQQQWTINRKIVLSGFQNLKIRTVKLDEFYVHSLR